MIKYIICFILIICISWILFQKNLNALYVPKKGDKKNIKHRILTYNIQKFPWSFKTFEKIKKLFEANSIILLQECYDESFSNLETHFPNYYICRGTLSGINIMNSGLVILSKYPIIESTFFQFNDYNPLSFDCLTEKGFLVAKIAINNQKICIINTHLQSSDFQRFDPNAFLQMNQLLAYINKNNEPYIIGGDFNIDIKDFNLKYNLNIHYPIEPTIYIDFKTSMTNSSFKHGYEGLIFDYFITSDNFKLQPITIANNFSDHNPVCSNIIF